MIVARTTGLAGFTPLKQTGGSNQYNQEQENKKAPKKKGWLDWTQDVLDVGGFIPGVGVVLDLANAGISLGRAAFGDEEDRKYHLGRAALSGVAAVPGLDYAAAAGKGLTKLQKAKKLIPTANPITHARRNVATSIGETAVGVDYTLSDSNPLVTGEGYESSSDMEMPDGSKVKDRQSLMTRGIIKGIQSLPEETGAKVVNALQPGENAYQNNQRWINSDGMSDPNQKPKSKEEQENVIDNAIEKIKSLI